MEFNKLYEIAKSLVNPRQINEFVITGVVGAAIVTDKGNVYTGINMDVACGIGFCAEHAAVADMVKHGEYKVERMVAVGEGGKILPPCGRCRELVNQIGNDNAGCEVLLPGGSVAKLGELLPYDWRK